jgi:hypothetical protein
MTPKDVWLVFEGWNDAHSEKKPGADAMSRAEYEALKEKIDGNQR